jgi:hypothetical protein
MELYKKVCKSKRNYTPTWLIFFLKCLYLGILASKKVCKSLWVIVKIRDLQTFGILTLFESPQNRHLKLK